MTEAAVKASIDSGRIRMASTAILTSSASIFLPRYSGVRPTNGDEYIAYERGGDGRGNVTMMVQVPDTFDPTHGCIVAAPSSGSRGVYGAIATAGEWGLKRGCAVAYTDKGTGTGAHDLQNNTVNLIPDQATEAQRIINDYGILPEQNLVQPGYWFANVSQSISVTYANAYGRFSVRDHLCDYSFAANAGVAGGPPVPLAAASEAQIFGTSNGIPPTSGIALINNAAPGGPKEDRGSTLSQNLDGALCLRSLAAGRDAATGQPLGRAQRTQARRIVEGVEDVIATGDLRRVPSIFVTGRNDGILPPNHTSRAYFGLNNVVEGSISPLRYYEVTNAHHLDSFNQFPTYNAMFIPLHRYFNQAMDLMYEHLRHGRPLPPSQVVHTIPRGPGAPPITPANVPAIADSPPASARITFTDGQVNIPE